MTTRIGREMTGDPALRIQVVLDEDTVIDADHIEPICDLKRAIHDSLLQHGITLFPYIFLIKPSELAEAAAETDEDEEWYDPAKRELTENDMSSSALTVTATFEDGVLRPDQLLPLTPRQRVTLLIQIPESNEIWPENVAEIYREIDDSEKRLSAAMFSTVCETWPESEGQP